MKFKANPVEVEAEVISEAENFASGETRVRLIGGRSVDLKPEVTARYKPVAGDYLVTQEDGYVYVNPKDVFERKYSVVVEPLPAAEKSGSAVPTGDVVGAGKGSKRG